MFLITCVKLMGDNCERFHWEGLDPNWLNMAVLSVLLQKNHLFGPKK